MGRYLIRIRLRTLTPKILGGEAEEFLPLAENVSKNLRVSIPKWEDNAPRFRRECAVSPNPNPRAEPPRRRENKKLQPPFSFGAWRSVNADTFFDM